MDNTNSTIIVNYDNFEDFMWMSYRYCIGRHSIASVMHAGTIAQYAKYLTPHSLEHAVTDIRNEINDAFRWNNKYNVKITNNTYYDVVSIILNAFAKRDIQDVNPSLLKAFNIDNLIIKDINIDGINEMLTAYKFDIDPTYNVCNMVCDEKQTKYTYTMLCDDMRDLLPWVKLANYMDKHCHRYIELNGEVVEVFPYYSMTSKSIEILYVDMESYINSPSQTVFIDPEHLNFISPDGAA